MTGTTRTPPAPAKKATPARKPPAKKAMPPASSGPPGGGGAGPRPAPAGTPDESEVRLFPLALLDDHPDNPPGRSQPDPELIASVRSVGLLQPLLVTPGPAGRFTIVAGHRRRAALVEAGRTEALCQVRADLTGGLVDVAMAVENGRRKGLGALEEAALYARLRDRDGLAQRAIAEQVGVDQSHVSRLLSLLRLPEQARAQVALEQVAVQDAAQLAQFTAHPEAFEVAWTYLTTYGGITEARRRGQARVDKLKRAQALLGAGKKVHDGYVSTGQGFANGYMLEVSEAKHAKLDCHVVVLFEQGGESWACDDPSSHPQPKRATSTSDAKAREDARERTKAMKARTAAARLVEQWPTSPAAAAPILARALAGRLGHAETMNLAIGWMQANMAPGLDTGAAPYTAEKLILAHGDDRLLVRYGCALALAAQEATARASYRPWGRQDALYLHRLVRDGRYQPSAWERTRLSEQAGIVDVEGFLLAEDPTPHLQPSQRVDVDDDQDDDRQPQDLDEAGVA